MTEYEFMDSRSTLGDRVTSVMQFWLTVTFAVYAATFYVGRDLDVFSSVAIILFYALTTFVSWSMIWLITGQARALARDAEVFVKRSELKSEILKPQVFAPKTIIFRVFLALMATSLVAFCFYTFQHTF